ncbi:MAG: neutral/alkaline non-lysosomal ceramidase N-terminal domain-containing protein, partial [Mycobacterium sp.]
MTYRVGRGISDITGEPAACGMLGYGKADQRTAGIHLRQRCRAFVIDDGDTRVLLVVAEIPLPMQNVTDEVLRRLGSRFGTTYTEQNTLVTVTHTHSGPGGYCGHTLYNMTTNGFHPKTFGAIVDGIVDAVQYAHDDLAEAQLALIHGELHDANVNRSRSSFDRNPSDDKAFFPDAVDPQTSLLRIERDGRSVGAVNFFATHGTSMTNRNMLISSDNKGYAAYHWERLDRGADYLADAQPDFISAFAQTNAGDMSPNLDVGKGPTDDEFENTRIIGTRQYEAARKLLSGPGTRLDGRVDARFTYVDLGAVEVRPEFTPDAKPHRTSRPMFAASQMAGTDEGEGFPGFRQGLNNPLWEGISRIAYRMNPALRDAQEPKGIFAPASLTNRLTDFVQERVPVQLIRIGQLYLIGIPGEVTIVAGLRLRRTVAAIVGAELADVLVVGYSNAYIHYVTTPEEYLEQRYEGGSTLFGRWELPALQQVAAELAVAMRDGRPAPVGGRPT